MEEPKEWTVQVLDAEGNIRYQSEIIGTERQARALCLQLEQQRRNDRDTTGMKTKKETIAHKRWF